MTCIVLTSLILQNYCHTEDRGTEWLIQWRSVMSKKVFLYMEVTFSLFFFYLHVSYLAKLHLPNVNDKLEETKDSHPIHSLAQTRANCILITSDKRMSYLIFKMPNDRLRIFPRPSIRVLPWPYTNTHFSFSSLAHYFLSCFSQTRKADHLLFLFINACC